MWKAVTMRSALSVAAVEGGDVGSSRRTVAMSTAWFVMLFLGKNVHGLGGSNGGEVNEMATVLFKKTVAMWGANDV